MKYTVLYKLPGQWFWRQIKNVKGDGVVLERGDGSRFFILEDETRVELPSEAAIRFAPARFEMIKANMARQAGQPIQTN